MSCSLICPASNSTVRSNFPISVLNLSITAAGLFSVCDLSEDGDLSETSVTVEGEAFYRLNLEQHEYLLQYLDILLSNTHHAFEEPFFCHLG